MRDARLTGAALVADRVECWRTLSTWALVALLLPVLSACALLNAGQSKPIDTYDLTAPKVGQVGSKRRRLQILVAEPSALKLIDSQNIVVRRGAAQVEYLGGAQWGDRLPSLVQARLVQTLLNADFAGAVGRPGEGLATDYQILTEIRTFEIATSGTDRAVVEMFVKIINDRNGVVAAQRTFSASQTVGGTENNDYAKALIGAFHKVAKDIASWTARSVR